MKQWCNVVICSIVGWWMGACSSDNEVVTVPDGKGHIIGLHPVHGNPTRALLYEDDGSDFFKVGNEFSVNAYFDDDGGKYINNGRVWYRGEAGNRADWITLDENDQSIDYYWPRKALNFFAYMPNDNYSESKIPVTIGDYTEANGQQFSCTLPATSGEVESMREFIYAYTPKSTEQAHGTSGVPLHFVHPFAVVCFQMKAGSYRMTVEELAFNGIKLSGTFSTGQINTANGIGTWTTDGEGSSFTATVNKRIPGDVNYNTVFAGPYLVIPQPLSNVKLQLNATRAKDKENTEEASINKETALSGTWEPGKKYTYTLHHGDNKEEIYFTVKVEDWIPVDHRNEIKVE